MKWGGWEFVNSARSQGSSSVAMDPWTQLDGRLQAPVGATIQFPNLLNPYGTGTNGPGGAGPPAGRYRWPTNYTWSSGNLIQPPWEVAGIDYPVGINASALPLKDVSSNTTLGGSLATSTGTGFSQTLTFSSVPSWVQTGMFVQGVDLLETDPAQFAFPPGTTITLISGGNVTVSNAPNVSIGSGAQISFSNYRGIYPHSTQFIVYVLEDNITMDGWDFSAGTGWGWDSEQNLGVTLKNCKFTFGTNQEDGVGGIGGSGRGLLAGNGIVFNSGGVMEYCELYCNGLTIETQIAIGLYGGIGRSLTTTVQYCYIFQASGIAIRSGDSFGGSSHIIQYNLIQDCGMGANSFGFHGDVVQCFPPDTIHQLLLLQKFNFTYQQSDATVTGAANQGFTENGIGSTQPTAVLQHDYMQNNTTIMTGNGNMNEFGQFGNPPNCPDNQATNNYVAPNTYSITAAGWQFLNKNAPGTVNVDTGNVNMVDGTTLT